MSNLENDPRDDSSHGESKILWDKVRGSSHTPVLYSSLERIAWLDADTLEADNYYSHDYRKKFYTGNKASVASNHNSMKSLQVDRVGLITEFLSKHDSLLEVGCSSGYFLEAISEICTNTTGLECNNSEVSYGQSLGLKIIHGDLGAVTDVYDHICLFQVLEHQQDPHEFLSVIRSLLADTKGYLHVEVPTLQNPLVSLYQCNEFRDFWFQSPHKYYYTDYSLITLLTTVGFQVCNVSLRQKASLANHFNWFYNKKPMADKKSSIHPYTQLEFANDIFHDNGPVQAEALSLLHELDNTYKRKLEDLGFGDTLFVTCKKI